MISVLFRIKQRKFEEMEEDLLNEKLFDLIIQIKGLSLLLPEYGIYKQFDYFNFCFSHFLIYCFFSDCKTMVVHFNNFILESSFNDDKHENKKLFQVWNFLIN